MKSSDKLKYFMRPGRIYRRQELKIASSAVDRDLKTLVSAGHARKIAGGLYCRTGGAAPPEEKELIRAFLKSDDFLLASRADFDRVVYNRKRSGDFYLDGRRFRFRIVRTDPRSPRADEKKTSVDLGGACVARDRLPVRVLAREDARGDLEYWLGKSPAERLAAVEFLREQYYALSGCRSLPRLAHDIRLRSGQK